MTQVVRLRICPVLEAQKPAGVRLAGQQERLDALGAAQGPGGIEQLVNRGAALIQRPVAVGVVVADLQGEVPLLVGGLVPFADCF